MNYSKQCIYYTLYCLRLLTGVELNAAVQLIFIASNKIDHSNMSTGHTDTPGSIPTTATMHDHSTVSARYAKVYHNLIHDSVGATHSPSQMGAQLVRPFLHAPYTLYCADPFCPKSAPTVGESGICTWFLGPTKPTTPNSISIKSAIFPQHMIITNRQTDRELSQ